MLEKGALLMIAIERERIKVMELVKRKHLTLKDACDCLALSYRQVKRIFKKYKTEGSKGIIHKNRGRKSNRKTKDEDITKILKLQKEKYTGFGPNLMSEKLELDGIKIDHETLRKILIKNGLWERKRNRQKHRSRRERKQHFGEMIQLDGSHHQWFENNVKKSCLMNMIDDSTNTTLSLMAQEETTEAAMLLLWSWIDKYGIPMSIYCDRKNVFVTDREATIDEQIAGVEPKTAFGLACEKLGIRIITASSPQAKGRVERNHAVYQDRFVKELRLLKINNIKGANELLKTSFIDNLNKKFSLKAANEKDFHRSIAKSLDLRNVFCYESIRTVSNDYVVRYENKLFQIHKDNKLLPRTAIYVRIDVA
ncbi:MAG: ISNCY family transposase [Spirochaetes bacterium]|nr:ISNCY family transposase [Spirochaetota bacterium]